MQNRSITRSFLFLLAVVTTLGTTACAGRQVSRVASNQAIDLSGRWNDTDSRLVAEELIKQSFESPYGSNWAMRYSQSNAGDQPTVIVGTIRNRSMEHIPVNTFVRDLERAYINSGLVRVVASSEERSELRAEREDQQGNAAADTRAAQGMETGADFMLQGELQSIEDSEGGESVVFYQVDLTLVDLQSNAKVWSGQHKIKKFIDRGKLGW